MRALAPVGVLMLETQFPRLQGDVGHAGSWPCPVLFETIPAATPDRVVRKADQDLLPDFIAAGHRLVAQGATTITTSCGFLTLFQRELAEALPVPVVTSSLCLVADLADDKPPKTHPGILTIAASALTQRHLDAAGVAPGTPIGTTETGQDFTRAILSNAPEFDVDLARADNVAAASALKADVPSLDALVLECTNMGPYADDIRAATGVPVFTIIDAVMRVHGKHSADLAN